MLQVTRITTDEQFAEIGPEWNELLQSSKQQDLLLSHEWFMMCRRWFCSRCELYTLAVRLDGRLVGVAPLQIRKIRRYGLTVRQLCFVHESLPWYRGDFIIADQSDQVLTAMLDHLCEYRGDWDFARFEGIAEQSKTVDALLRLGTQSGLSVGFWRIFNEASMIPIQGEWEDFLHSCGPHLRKRLNNSENRLRRSGQLEFHTTREPKRVEELLRTMYSLQEDNQRYKQEQLPESDRISSEAGLFLGREFAKTQSAEVKLMTIDGMPVAGWFSVDVGRTSFALVTKHNVQYAKCSPGVVMMQDYLRDAWRRNTVDRIDYLMTWPYLQRWTSHADRYLKVECFHTGMCSRLLRSAYELRGLRRPYSLPRPYVATYD
ncbi:MAG: GNAT family N-acetyltransferase [Nitrospira sp.]|jgi:CelD/BcsL family acetyltransferase involved in cellulose biosynthesis